MYVCMKEAFFPSLFFFPSPKLCVCLAGVWVITLEGEDIKRAFSLSLSCSFSKEEEEGKELKFSCHMATYVASYAANEKYSSKQQHKQQLEFQLLFSLSFLILYVCVYGTFASFMGSSQFT